MICEKHGWNEGTNHAPCPECIGEMAHPNNPFLAAIRAQSEWAIATNHNGINDVVYTENPARALEKSK